ncbi:hypothetical protein [uncultured Ilyobacter sp.]|uniref:hypothetical protein n=1 Tax=uncultured Ilyobacter sp. TaxID=544433 RepID=UPI0029BFF7A6|nr:hypothetical protein [uncultured Ilyobacter sp.]
MIFFDDFIKKVEKKDLPLDGKYSFGLEIKKIVVWLGTGIPLMLLGAYQFALGYTQGMKIGYIIFGVVLFILGLGHLWLAFSYKISVDFQKNSLKNKKVDIVLDEIENCTMSKMVAPGGKKLQTCVEIITKDKVKVIIPLIMRNKINFAALLRKKLGNKFEIIRD